MKDDAKKNSEPQKLKVTPRRQEILKKKEEMRARALRENLLKRKKQAREKINSDKKEPKITLKT